MLVGRNRWHYSTEWKLMFIQNVASCYVLCLTKESLNTATLVHVSVCVCTTHAARRSEWYRCAWNTKWRRVRPGVRTLRSAALDILLLGSSFFLTESDQVWVAEPDWVLCFFCWGKECVEATVQWNVSRMHFSCCHFLVLSFECTVSHSGISGEFSLNLCTFYTIIWWRAYVSVVDEVYLGIQMYRVDFFFFIQIVFSTQIKLLYIFPRNSTQEKLYPSLV